MTLEEAINDMLRISRDELSESITAMINNKVNLDEIELTQLDNIDKHIKAFRQAYKLKKEGTIK